MIGRQISHYEILEEIGRGGMGQLFRARDTRLDREIAIKLLAPSMAENPDHLRRFTVEAKAIAALNHPNVVTIFSVEHDEATDLHFLTMELLSGTNLDQLIPSGGMALDRFFNLVIPITEGLACAHERGIVHRDLKPANVMVTADGRVKLLDFGLAKVEHEGRGSSVENLSVDTATHPGTVLGTLPYMAPEQLRGESVDPRADIFSLGVILYRMATGRHPFGGQTTPEVISAILRDTPVPPGEIRDDVPWQLGRIIMSCLERDSRNRCPSVVELRDRLQQIGQSLDRRDRAPEGEAIGEIVSVAVLPFIDLGAEQTHGHLADGLAEDLINALSKIKELRVAARTSAFSLKGGQADVREIGQTLGVSAVLEGSVQLVEGRLVVRARLISVDSGFPLLTFRFDRTFEDVFAIQEEISSEIVRKLKGQLVHSEQKKLINRHPKNRETFDLYLKGVYAWNRRFEGKVLEALECFRAAIEKEPEYALAHTGLADCFIVLGWYAVMPPKQAFPKARSAAQMALDINDSLAEAHNSMAAVKNLYDWDWPAAEEDFERALELRPDFPLCHWWYAYMLMVTGQTERSVQVTERAMELDPLSLVINSSAGWLFHLARENERAMDLLQRAVEMDPSFAIANAFLAWAYEARGEYDAALEAWANAEKQMAMPTLKLQRAHTVAISGDVDQARALLEEAAAIREKAYVSSCQEALVHLALASHEKGARRDEEMERVWKCLEAALEDRDCWLLSLNVDPRFDPLRGDDRLNDLSARVGLPVPAS